MSNLALKEIPKTFKVGTKYTLDQFPEHVFQCTGFGHMSIACDLLKDICIKTVEEDKFNKEKHVKLGQTGYTTLQLLNKGYTILDKPQRSISWL